MLLLRSNILTSPLSYPEAITRSYVVCALPNATDQQSGFTSASTGYRVIVGNFCLGSHSDTTPSRPPVTI